MTLEEIEALEIVRFMNFNWSEEDLSKSWQTGARSNPEGDAIRNRRFVLKGKDALIYDTIGNMANDILLQTSKAGYALGRRSAGFEDIKRYTMDKVILWISLPSSASPDEADRVEARYSEEGLSEPVSVSVKSAIIHKEIIVGILPLLGKVAKEAYLLGRNLALAEKG